MKTKSNARTKKLEILESTTFEELERAKLIDKYTAKVCTINEFITVRDLLLYYSLLGTLEFCPTAGDSETEQLLEIIRIAQKKCIEPVINVNDSAFIRTAYLKAMPDVYNRLDNFPDHVRWAKDEFEKSLIKLNAMLFVKGWLEDNTIKIDKKFKEYHKRFEKLKEAGARPNSIVVRLARIESDLRKMEYMIKHQAQNKAKKK